MTYAPWAGIARRMDDWASCQTMAATAAMDRTDLYLRALDLEKSIDTTVTGKAARGPRAALGAVMGPHWDASRKQLNGYGLRSTYWEAVAIAADLEARLEELRQVLA